MNVTLQELLHAINIIGQDRDITVDGIDSIAVCPPIKMTAAGRKHFKQALMATVVVEYEDDCHQDTYVSDDNEEVDEEAWNLLASLAGYCAEDKFDKWFENEKAELV